MKNFFQPTTFSQKSQHNILGTTLKQVLFFFFNFIYLFIYLFGCVGSSFLCEGFLQLWRAGATLHHGARASHCRGLSCCRAQAPDAQAQQLWLTGSVAPRHVGSSQTRAQTRVPCIGRQILNHCATREAPKCYTFYIQNYLRIALSSGHHAVRVISILLVSKIIIFVILM